MNGRTAFVVAALMEGLLGVQFLLGMAINLYVPIATAPRSPASGTAATAGTGTAMGAGMVGMGPVVALHLMLGVVLVVGAIAAFAASLIVTRAAAASAGAALVAVLASGIAGLAFLMGGQSNASSMYMAAGFLVAAAAYLLELLALRAGSGSTAKPWSVTARNSRL
ncbi:MAG: hypothetical protein ACYDH5_13940 [Acidimicrobiales bacterium]